MKPPALVFAADSLEKKSKCVLNDVDFLFRAGEKLFWSQICTCSGGNNIFREANNGHI